jgi:UDP-N-acetylmuramoyl-tripeptide--D-alanyl-D-alanine ligase
VSALWTAEDAAAATGGRIAGDWQAQGLSIDTRSLQPGDLFVALTDQRDGHDFVADALARGAAGALVSRVPAGVADTAPLLVVPDVLQALRDLATARRAATQARVIAVTGSVGKTSTKEMLRAALTPLGRVHAAEKSFNNHLGVPLTLARCPLDADFAVIEIGMNHPGEIAPLAALAAPDLAIVTIVAAAHLEAFENLKGIAHEKASIFGGLRPGGIAVWNADLDTSPILRAAAGAAGGPSLSFGQTEGADMRLVTVTAEAEGLRYTLAAQGIEFQGHLRAPGRHLAMNAAAVICAVRALGLDCTAALDGLGQWTPPEGRGTRQRIVTDSGAFDLIDEAYNANPTSMAAALSVLAETRPGPDGRRVAVLGDMLELGADEAAMHAALADLPELQAVATVHCLGPRMRHLWQRLPAARRGLWAETAQEIAEQARSLVRTGDVVMVKGSNGSRAGQVAAALRALAHRAGE